MDTARHFKQFVADEQTSKIQSSCFPTARCASLLRNKNTPIPAALWIRAKFCRGANARGINPFSACHRVRPC